MQKHLFYVTLVAMIIIVILVIPAGTFSVSTKPGGVREVIPAVGETPKSQPATQEERVA